MKRQLGVLLLSLLVAIQAGVAGITGYVLLNRQPAKTLPLHTYAGELAVGGLSPEAALRQIFSDPQQAGLPGVLRIFLPDNPTDTSSGRAYPVDGAALVLVPAEQPLREQLVILSSVSRWERMLQSLTGKREQERLQIRLPVTGDAGALWNATATIAAVWQREAVSAVASLEGETLSVAPEVWGRQLDEARFMAWLTDALAAGGQVEKGVLSLIPDREAAFLQFVEPAQKASLYADMRRAGSADLLLYEGGARDAAQAAQRLSGTLLSPGDSFSMREWMRGSLFSPLTPDAPSRVATAVFRSLMPLSGISVEQRAASPYATNYAPPGQEAVLLEDTDDLVLANRTEQPVLLMAAAEGEAFRVVAFTAFSGAAGTLFSDVTQTMEPPLIQSMSRDLSPGEVRVISPGRAGMQVSVFRVGDGGKVFLHEDLYPAQNRILEVGMQPDPRLGTK